jgi:septum formation protein
VLILASASPRRKDLLGAAGFTPQIAPQEVDERPHPGEAPIPYVARIAKEKAAACFAKGEVPPQAVVVAADTTVALDGEILGKAADAFEAASMLSRLAGRTHAVHTAVVVGRWEGTQVNLHSRVVTTAVRFRAYGPSEIQRYVASGEVLDKAGAYGIQGQGGALVASVEGSYTNVVGLPLEETLELLALVGARP